MSLKVPFIILGSLSALGIGAIPSSYAEDRPPTPEKTHTFTATATLASDYMFRGVSQTMNDPAVHASFEYAHASGVSAGIWGSNVDSTDGGPADDQADQEIDIYIGYGASLNDDWAMDATAIRYIFPGTASGFDLDWNEFQVQAHYREYVSFLFAYSNEVFNLEDPGIYYGLSGNYPLADGRPLAFADSIRLTASVGYYDLDDALGDSYVDWSIGVEADMGIFTARLAYLGADDSGEDLLGGGEDKADPRLMFSLTAEFGQ